MKPIVMRLHRRYELLALGERRLFWLLFVALVLPWAGGGLVFTLLRPSEPIWLLGGVAISILALILNQVLVLIRAKREGPEPDAAMLPGWAAPLLGLELVLIAAPIFLLFAEFRMVALANHFGDRTIYVVKRDAESRLGEYYLLEYPAPKGYLAAAQVIENRGKLDFAWPEDKGQRGVVDAQAFAGQRWRVLFPVEWKSLFSRERSAPTTGLMHEGPED